MKFKCYLSRLDDHCAVLAGFTGVSYALLQVLQVKRSWGHLFIYLFIVCTVFDSHVELMHRMNDIQACRVIKSVKCLLYCNNYTTPNHL